MWKGGCQLYRINNSYQTCANHTFSLQFATNVPPSSCSTLSVVMSAISSHAPMSIRTVSDGCTLSQSHGNFMRSCVKRMKCEIFTYSALCFGQDGLNWVHSNNSCLPTIYSQARVNRLTYIEVYVLMPSQPLAPHVPHKQRFFSFHSSVSSSHQ